MPDFNAKKVSKVKAVDPDASYSVEGTAGGSFAIASSKKELKQLMKSDAAVVYDEKKGKLYLNENGTAKGWGAKKVGGLIAKFKGKPELSAEQFEGMEAFDAVTGDHDHEHDHGHEHGGDTKEQIASYRETLTDSEEADLLVDFNLEPKKALKRVIKDGKKEGYVFDRDELAEELEEMDKGGAFTDIELDAAAMEALFSQGGEQEGRSRQGC
ncbi:hypothetical protein KR100_09875 [Synechococcus sp. KORDI-100]|uniref:hypothetical protein n=1 Tax=Synechococcus sp. KORDI-100 TaxID=1280380 RepID=UPI0004E0797A|nr:hypothetical protein [Synechococcus sp. KORDI-100]AII43668.1 hypothetical protein KR100_09875 [Synechococcus sp. KORDI-100]